MAISYKQQGYIETLATKTESTSGYASDQRTFLYGGRGSKYDELVYLRAQNTDAEGVNTKLSDAWTKFGPANGAAGARADQIFHDYTVNGLYP